jgi:hypothetical protein
MKIRSLLLIISIAFGNFVVIDPAEAATKNEMKFLKQVKLAKVATLKKNTDKELIAIGKTMCEGTTYYASTIEQIYKANHFVQSIKAGNILTKAARSFLCAKKILVIDSNGDSSRVTVFEQDPSIIWAEPVESSGTGIEQKLSEASKTNPLINVSPTPTTTQEATVATVSPGAFCTPAGATGKSANGTSYTCKTSPTDTRNRWRQ